MTRNYIPRDERPKNPTPIRIGERDLDILQAVYEYRLLTTEQIQLLFFPSINRAYERLKQLYNNGLLYRRFLGEYTDKMNRPTLYVLDKRGAEILQAERGLDINWNSSFKYVTVTFLEHTLALSTVRVAFDKACRDTAGFAIYKWVEENSLKKAYDYVAITNEQGRRVSVSVIPDGYLVLQTPLGYSAFFIELDRATEPTRRFKQKILAYKAYYEGGGYFKRYQTKSLRVLTVTTSKLRLRNLRNITEQAGGEQRFWFTAIDQITPATILKTGIWDVATQLDKKALVALEE